MEKIKSGDWEAGEERVREKAGRTMQNYRRAIAVSPDMTTNGTRGRLTKNADS